MRRSLMLISAANKHAHLQVASRLVVEIFYALSLNWRQHSWIFWEKEKVDLWKPCYLEFCYFLQQGSTWHTLSVPLRRDMTEKMFSTTSSPKHWVGSTGSVFMRFSTTNTIGNYPLFWTFSLGFLLSSNIAWSKGTQGWYPGKQSSLCLEGQLYSASFIRIVTGQLWRHSHFICL